MDIKLHNSVKVEYEMRMNTIQKQVYKKIVYIAFALSILTLLMFLLFQLEIVPIFVVWITGGLTIATWFIYLLVFLYYAPSKPFYEYLLPTIFSELEYENGITYRIIGKPKANKILIGNRLCPQGSMSTFHSIIQYVSNFKKEISIYDVENIISTGKTTVYYLNGIYISFVVNDSQLFQLRSKGTPNRKGVPLQRFHTNHSARTFLSSDISQLNSVYYTIFEQIYTTLSTKNIIVGQNYETFFIAFDISTYRRMKTLNEDSYQALVEFYKNLFLLVENVEFILKNQ